MMLSRLLHNAYSIRNHYPYMLFVCARRFLYDFYIFRNSGGCRIYK